MKPQISSASDPSTQKVSILDSANVQEITHDLPVSIRKDERNGDATRPRVLSQRSARWTRRAAH